MIDKEDDLPITRQCELLNLNRSTVYCQCQNVSEVDLRTMRSIDEIHLKRLFYGSRRILDWLQNDGHDVNRKRVQRLMRLMGITVPYPKRRTSMPGKGDKLYPYLLRNRVINCANQVWAADISYIPMAKGFVYLVVIIDWCSRKVLSWRLSNMMNNDFCVEALEDALSRYGRQGRWVDNVFGERLWRSVKYEEVYLKS